MKMKRQVMQIYLQWAEFSFSGWADTAHQPRIKASIEAGGCEADASVACMFKLIFNKIGAVASVIAAALHIFSLFSF